MIQDNDFENTLSLLQQSYPHIPASTIRLWLHNCGGSYQQTKERLQEISNTQIPGSFPGNQKRTSDRDLPFSAKLPQLQNEMNKLNEKNISLLEQKIAKQEADISLLKDMIKARDLAIERLQKDLQELSSLREREKSSASVVTELAQSIKSNVDSSFKAVQENTDGVDLSKLVIEVKKQLAMSFLGDFKETKIDRSTTGSKIWMNSPATEVRNPSVPQDKPNPSITTLPNIASLNITGVPSTTAQTTSNLTNLHPGISGPAPLYNYPPYNNNFSSWKPTTTYTPTPNPFYYPSSSQPSAPSFFPMVPNTDPTLNLKPN